jgi:hypothetical protein
MDKAEQELVSDIAQYDNDPVGFVRYVYPWGEGELANEYGARAWQQDILSVIRDHLQSDRIYTPLHIAVSSGHGIGKSSLISMIAHWALSTHVDCRVLTTANTGQQLSNRTWPEVCKWTRLAINSHWFDPTATRISVKDKAHAVNWRHDQETWSETNTAAFAGLHNVGKMIVVIYDEASEIPDKIWEVTSGALTDERTIIIWLAFGNPTRNTGRFRECFGRYKDDPWITRQIDSRTVPGTNKEYLQGLVDQFGEDSDYVRVRVKGEFPRAAFGQFIGGDVVFGARKRKVEVNPKEFIVLSCDVARSGADRTVIGYRQGMVFRVLETLRGSPINETADRVCKWMKELTPRTTVIDGDGIGGGVVDNVRKAMGGWMISHPNSLLVEFHGGASPADEFMYFNKRAEVWGRMRDWLAGGDIPDIPELDDDLTGPNYSCDNGPIKLERKVDMKKRGLSSPDIGDTLAMTFNAYVRPTSHDEKYQAKMNESNPEERMMIAFRETKVHQRRPTGPSWMGNMRRPK